MPIGKVKNFQLWPGKSRWIFGGSLVIGKEFWRPMTILLIIIIVNGASFYDYFGAKLGKNRTF